MPDFIISTESTCDLSSESLKRLNVESIAMEYAVKDEIYGGDTNRELSSSDFYSRMRVGDKTRTSMINEERARDFLKELLSSGKDVLHISFASACSGTYNSFKRVADELNKKSENKVYVVDSRCECTGQGLLVRLCSERRKSGATILETLEYAEDILHRIVLLFTVDNLKYLEAGGRVKKSTATIGNVLNIKPVLYVNEDGYLTPGSKVISRKASLSKLAKLTVDKFSGESPYVYVSHADCEADANLVASRLATAIPQAQIMMESIGPVIGSHSGPGTIAIFFVGRDRVF